MKKSSIVLAVIGIIIVVGGIWAYTNYTKYAPATYITQTPSPDGTTTTTTTDTTTHTTTPGAPTYTMAQVATHKDATSCYTVIQGIVYDLTMWVNMHPGGRGPILSICGVDGTAPFANQHHFAQKQMGILARFKIGLLVQ